MEYNFTNKTLNENIDLVGIEWKIIELLIKMNGQPVNDEKIADMLFEKYPWNENISGNSVRNSICKINKKTNGLIKNKVRFGYYIEEIKFSWESEYMGRSWRSEERYFDRCPMCGERKPQVYMVQLKKQGRYTAKKLTRLCQNCYLKVLDFIGISDVAVDYQGEWNNGRNKSWRVCEN